MKYSALSWLSWIYKGLALFVLIGGLLYTVVYFLTPDYSVNFSTMEIETLPTNYVPRILFGVGVLFVSLGLYSAGELIQLLINMEGYTEQTARGIAALVKLQRQQQGLEPTSSMPQSMRKMLKVDEPEF